jgi:hypothetical protein
MKQTAVEWLFEQIPFEWSSSRAAFEAFKQAIEMQEQQRKEAYNQGIKEGIKIAVAIEWGEKEGGAK